MSEYGARTMEAVTDEIVTAAMREFEKFAARLLRYPEKDRWHMNDVTGMREALKVAFALAAAATPPAVPQDQREGELDAMKSSRLAELLAKYPEPWVIEKEPHDYKDGTNEFTHVRYYKTDAKWAEGEKVCIEIGGYLTPDLAELLILLRESAPVSPGKGEGWREAIEACIAAQPCTASKPNESAYCKGHFDGVMDYGRAIRNLRRPTPPSSVEQKNRET